MSESEIGDKCSILTCTNYNQVNIFGMHCYAERVTVILDRSVEQRYKMLYQWATVLMTEATDCEGSRWRVPPLRAM